MWIQVVRLRLSHLIPAACFPDAFSLEQGRGPRHVSRVDSDFRTEAAPPGFLQAASHQILEPLKTCLILSDVKEIV